MHPITFWYRFHTTLMLVLIVVVMFLLSRPAHSHSWYDPACCSGDDCRPVPDDELEELANGDLKHHPTGLVFSKKRIKPSQDKHQHICIYKGSPICAYTRQGS